MLQQIIFQNIYFYADNPKTLHMIADEFKSELQRLRNALTASEPGIKDSQEQNHLPLCYLYNKEYNEVNQTLISILALK